MNVSKYFYVTVKHKGRSGNIQLSAEEGSCGNTKPGSAGDYLVFGGFQLLVLSDE